MNRRPRIATHPILAPMFESGEVILAQLDGLTRAKLQSAILPLTNRTGRYCGSTANARALVGLMLLRILNNQIATDVSKAVSLLSWALQHPRILKAADPLGRLERAVESAQFFEGTAEDDYDRLGHLVRNAIDVAAWCAKDGQPVTFEDVSQYGISARCWEYAVRLAHLSQQRPALLQIKPAAKVRRL